MSALLEYNPQFFDAGTMQEAMAIVLTDEGDGTTSDRWLKETPYLAGLAIDHLAITSASLVLDYGCGVGRLAKEIIRRTGCRVVGADISASMRAFACHYVNSDRFIACHPGALDLLPKFDACLAVWVLQHCATLDADISAIASAMKPNASLLLVNNQRRVVPFSRGLERGWADDGRDVAGAVGAELTGTAHGALDPDQVGAAVAQFAAWSVYRK